MKRKILLVCLLISLAACQPSMVTSVPTLAPATAMPTAAPFTPPVSSNGNFVTTASGLKYADVVVGTGAAPQPTDFVTIQYTGTLQDGTVFDASRQHGGPVEFPLNQVIPGFSEGVGSMKVGGVRQLVIPPSLGYGSRTVGSIPPNSTLTFVVELVSIKPAPQVKIEDLKVGDGAEAKTGNTVTVIYTGTLENGTMFDASSLHGGTFDFPLGAGQVIQGWDQGVAGMKVGGYRRLTIPPELGYGAQGAGSTIPPNATLIFDIQLVAVK